jgi:AcrR family transcriptional regulator
MGARKDDRRVQRTEQLLRTALVSLIEERGFEALTVQDIIDRANVGRATFYGHFDNKEDLLVSGFDGLRVVLKELQSQAHKRTTGSDERLFAFSHEMFAHIADYRERCFEPW